VNVGSHKIKLSRGQDLATPAFERHFSLLTKHYGSLAIINLLGAGLVGSKEGEAALSTAFQAQQSKSIYHDIPHLLWDYHGEGGAKNLDRLSGMLGSLNKQLEFFWSYSTGKARLQNGVIRTNCTDCLDRTNSVQMWLGLRTLHAQLDAMGLNQKEVTVTRFQDSFKEMWLSNGNVLSKLYAGTAALSQGGSRLMDGARSAARTIQNNLLDKDKQEAFDLLVHGSGKLTDLEDRARLLLPTNYWHTPLPFQHSLSKHWIEYTYSEPLRIAVGTYNINGGKHFRSVVYKDVSLDDWLLDGWKSRNRDLVSLGPRNGTIKPADIYAIGFEEMVDLNAKNIVNTSGENAKDWAEELRKILDRDKDVTYSLVTYQQLVGVCLYIFVRPHLAKSIRDVMIDEVKTGMGGTTGNKGDVAISLTYASTSFCFVCSHFAAGQNQINERNNDYGDAIKRIEFDNGRSLLSHDYVFWCGDFNYRISMDREEVKDAVLRKDYKTLVASDQLSVEREAGNVFHGFKEGDLNFAPTYKYDLFSDDYDTSEKCRAPAWTDRILWKRRIPDGPLPRDWNDGSLLWYGRAELKQSDHRPVLAVIDIQARVVDSLKREQVISRLLGTLGSYDGTVVATPVDGAGSSLISDDTVLQVQGLLEQEGSVRYSRLVRGQVWVQYRCCEIAGKMAGRIITIGEIKWEVEILPYWRSSMKEELAIHEGGKTLNTNASKKPPPRPSAPPARPALPPSLSQTRPSRPAPALPEIEKEYLSNNDIRSSYTTRLAPISWPEENSNSNKFSCLDPKHSLNEHSTSPSDSNSGPPSYLPPPLPCAASTELDSSLHDLSMDPPSFSPPSLPPSEPPSPLPKVPVRNPARLPPPIPRR